MSSPSTDSSYSGVDNGSTIVAIVGSLTAISAVFVGARLFVRIKLLQNLGLDDYLISIAMVNNALSPASSRNESS